MTPAIFFHEIVQKRWMKRGTVNELDTPGSYANYMSIQAECVYLEGRATALFMPDRNFCDWLVSCVDRLEPKHAEVIGAISENPIKCLLFPADAGLIPFLAWIPKETRRADGSPGPQSGVLVLTFSKGNGRLGNATIALDENYCNPKCSAEMLWYAKLVIGLGMYLACFPEQSFTGIPKDLAHADWFKTKDRITIGVSEEVVATGDTVTPHYRVGHFRLLSSERYTKKRGQVVFVRGCFVKGQAETIQAIE
jgi:hypothetical protein